MDYDLWLQREAGCFDDGPEVSDDEIFDYWNERFGNLSMNDFFNENPRGADEVSDKMWESEEVIHDYESGLVEDLDEWMKKYPERAEACFRKCLPKDKNELYDIVGRRGWDYLSSETFEHLYE